MIALLLFLLLLALHSSNPQPQPKLRWRDLTQEEIDGWYSPFDQCMMDTTVFYKSPQEIKRTFCANESTRMKDGRMGFCRVGMGSNKKECSAPYSGRRSYRRGIDGYTNASSKPIIEAFMRFSETNTALVFLGDSTMTQKRSALECELLRESPRMRLNGTKSSRGVLPCHSKQSVYVPGISTLVDVHGVSFGPSSLSCVKVKRKVARPEDFYEVAKDVLHQINFVDGKNMFIVANFGLWFNSKKYFQKTTSPALRWLNDIAMIPQFKNKVYWHETMSTLLYNFRHIPSVPMNLFHDFLLSFWFRQASTGRIGIGRGTLTSSSVRRRSSHSQTQSGPKILSASMCPDVASRLRIFLPKLTGGMPS